MNLNEAKKLLKSTGYILENSFPKEYGIETIIKVMQEHDWSPEFIYSCLKKNDNINDIISRIESVFEKIRQHLIILLILVQNLMAI